LITAKAIHSKRNNIERIDTGPVFPKEMEETTEKIIEAQSETKKLKLSFWLSILLVETLLRQK
jgi:hypothetical protein